LRANIKEKKREALAAKAVGGESKKRSNDNRYVPRAAIEAPEDRREEKRQRSDSDPKRSRDPPPPPPPAAGREKQSQNGDANGAEKRKRDEGDGNATKADPSQNRADPDKRVPFSLQKVVGPMVGASDLPFRLLCRRYGADVVYTEMLFSEAFVEDEAYRLEMMQSCREDHPLVVQFCGNNPATMAKAARLAEQMGADACDINLGCPLIHAKNNLFGAYLLDREHWSTVAAMVEAMREATRIPVFCKIRLLPELADTIELAQSLERAGCDMVAVHGCVESLLLHTCFLFHYCHLLACYLELCGESVTSSFPCMVGVGGASRERATSTLQT